MGKCSHVDSLPLFLLLFQCFSLHLWSCRWIPPTSILLLHLLLALWLCGVVDSSSPGHFLPHFFSRLEGDSGSGARSCCCSSIHRADSTWLFYNNNSGRLLPFAQLAGHTTGQMWEYGFTQESVPCFPPVLTPTLLHRAPSVEWGHPEFWTKIPFHVSSSQFFPCLT